MVRARTYQILHAVRCASCHRNREDHILPCPEKIDRRKNRNRNRKNHKSKREESEKNKTQVRQGSNRKQEIKKEIKKGNTQTRECAIFRRLQARTLLEGCRTETKEQKVKHTYSATKNTREIKRETTIPDKKQKGRRRRAKNKKNRYRQQQLL